MDEKIFRILRRPVSKWTKADALYAAKLLATRISPLPWRPRPRGIINSAMLPSHLNASERAALLKKREEEETATLIYVVGQKLADDQLDNKISHRKRGRKENLTTLQVAKTWCTIEERRLELAKEPHATKRITDIAVARSFADDDIRGNVTLRRRRNELIRYYQNLIKSVKRKLNSGA